MCRQRNCEGSSVVIVEKAAKFLLAVPEVRDKTCAETVG